MAQILAKAVFSKSGKSGDSKVCGEGESLAASEGQGHATLPSSGSKDVLIICIPDPHMSNVVMLLWTLMKSGSRVHEWVSPATFNVVVHKKQTNKTLT